MKIVTVIGARPQFIKAAVVSRAIARHNQLVDDSLKIEEVIIHTGQHYDENMSAVFFHEMKIPQPDYQLKAGGQSHGNMTGRLLADIEEILLLERPDVVIVYGDTNSTLAGALAAAKLQIPIAHVEAGLRSFDMKMPEEINRILTDRVARWLFCPTENAVRNLQDEGFHNMRYVDDTRPSIHAVGDVMLDAMLYYKKVAKPTERVKRILAEKKPFLLVTIHRAENTDNETKLAEIAVALETLAEAQTVIWPIHPRTRKRLAETSIQFDKVRLIDPVGYFDMLLLLDACRLVVTDSGGVQKESFFCRKPCITLREQTEWMELVERGYNYLVGVSYDKILSAMAAAEKADFTEVELLYGGGDAGEKIVEILYEDLK